MIFNFVAWSLALMACVAAFLTMNRTFFPSRSKFTFKDHIMIVAVGGGAATFFGWVLYECGVNSNPPWDVVLPVLIGYPFGLVLTTYHNVYNQVHS